MSLKKKIAISFFISAAIIAILAVFEYVTFVEIKKEIRYLEVTDTISRKSLQLRRHEKNYFLYSPQQAEAESASVHAYLEELKGLLEYPEMAKANTAAYRNSIAEYGQRFSRIESSAARLTALFEKTKSAKRQSPRFLSLVESTFLEQPLKAADFINEAFVVSAHHPLITGLRELDTNIAVLRKNGEAIVVISKDLDKAARERVETMIRVSQIAILIIFPLFLAVGVGTLFFISTSVVGRLRLLISVVETTGRGSYPHVDVPSGKWGNDEVGVLIRKFDLMEDQLAVSAVEIDRKNKELIHVKKLAAIGTLAAGVAHELNNPLNNIHLSAQVLAREAGAHNSPVLHEAVADIMGQTVRVKRIVGELLEFARGREPRLRTIDLTDVIERVYNKLTVDTTAVHFTLDAEPVGVVLAADLEQMEQVFINLFTNAVEAMPGGGNLSVKARTTGDVVTILVSDSGKGVPKDSLDKVFEPFFTTKDKGTGLGLAIVFNIIRKHYGEISVTSGEEKGTTFTITLPRMEEKVS